MVTPPKVLTGDSGAIEDFVDRFDTFLFDCDGRRFVRSWGKIALAEDARRIGVLWSGDHVFPGVVETLEMLRSKGKQLVFVTNNSTKSRADYKKKLDSLGIPSNVDEIFGSAYSSSIYISRILSLPAPRNKAFILGESGIESELAAEDVPYCGGTDPDLRRDMTSEDFTDIASGGALDPNVGVVLAGLDQHINYLKLSLAYQYLRRGAVFLATNTDSTFPSSGALFPGAGTMSIALINMLNGSGGTGGQQPTVMGKPHQAMMDAIEGKFKLDRGKTCMVGDRLDTDIKFGIEGGLGGTLHVGTGVSPKGDWEKVGTDGKTIVPTYYADTLGDLKA